MYKHLLLPTDGSELSQASVRTGITLAREQGARVTALYVIQDYNSILYGVEGLMTASNEEVEKAANVLADKALNFVADLAQQEGVPYELVRTTSLFPYLAITDQAKDSGCDLICMASHGRKGIRGFLIGSETQRVLTHSTIPVLVHRSSNSDDDS